MREEVAYYYLEVLKPLLTPAEKEALRNAINNKYGTVLINKDRQALFRIRTKVKSGWYKKKGIDVEEKQEIGY